MKKIFSLFIVIVMITSFAIPAQAMFSPTEEDYLARYAEYKDYYENVYVPSYNAYNQALSDLATEIGNTNFETVEQAQRVIDFLNDLKTRRNAFFGNRETVGTSRYLVPTLRTAMFDAASAEDYNSAYFNCEELITAVEARVSFLNTLKDEVNSFEVLVSDDIVNISVSFTVTTYNAWWYSYKMVITNNSDQDIENGQLLMNIDGDINSATLSGSGFNAWGPSTAGGFNINCQSGVFTLSPQNEWQAGYIIPAGTTLSFTGGGANIGGITSATMNGEPVDVTFTK